MKRIERVTIEKHPRVDPIKHKNYVCLRAADGEMFYNDRGKVRAWKAPGSAKQFLRRIGEIYNVAYIVTNLTGSTSLVNITRQELTMAENPERYGPHDWHKTNAATIIDGWGNYDVWRCDACKSERKQFGLSGRPPGDYCPANQKTRRLP